MKVRYLLMTIITLVMIGALFAGAVQALETERAPLAVRTSLENVRTYAPAVAATAPNYAVDGGVLFAGAPGAWTQVRTPDGIIVGDVAADSARPNVLYMGAANELALYRSEDGGQNWLRVPLSDEAGGVTDIAVDGLQRIVYAGTDSAGVFRLRDVGSSMVVGGQLLLDEPVREVVSDSSGANLAFARTDTALYRADSFGLAWTTVDNLKSIPTAVAIADGDTATVLVGTADRGVLASTDGLTWTMANEGLGMTAGSRLHIDALAADPTQPHQLYVAASYLLGSTSVHQTPSQVSMSSDGAESWTALDAELSASVAGLLPVSGIPGAVYAVTTGSRTPLALYDETATLASAPVQTTETGAEIAPSLPSPSGVTPIPTPWLIAALAALALGVFVLIDLQQRGIRPLAERVPLAPMDTQTLPTVG